MVTRIPYLKPLETVDYRYIILLDRGLRKFGDVGMDSVMWYYAARDWTDAEARTSGRSWRTQV